MDPGTAALVSIAALVATFLIVLSIELRRKP